MTDSGKFVNVSIPIETKILIEKFKKRNEKANKDITIVTWKFVNNAILEKLEREENSFQIKP